MKRLLASLALVLVAGCGAPESASPVKPATPIRPAEKETGKPKPPPPDPG